MKKNIFIAFFLLLALSAFAQKKASQKANRVIIPEANLEFKANDDYTEVTITRFKCDDKEIEKFKGKTLEIPSKIQGIPVTAIGFSEYGNRVFGAWGSDTEGIYIPEGVKVIGYHAFENSCFKNIYLPEGIEIIGEQAFCHSAFKNIYLPEGLKIIGELAFCESDVESINIPSTVKSIEERTFEYCKALKSITIPESVNYIGKSAFEGSGLQKLVFKGNRVCLYGECYENYTEVASFSGCKNLEQIEFPKDFTVLYYDGGDFGGRKEVQLTDFISGEKINASFALQKKLKAVKVMYWKKAYEEDELATEEEYSELVGARKYKEAIAAAQKFVDTHYKEFYFSNNWKQVANDTKELEEKSEPYNKDFEAGKYKETFETARKEQSNTNGVIRNIWKDRAETALITGYDKSFEKKDYESALDFAKTGYKEFHGDNWNNRIEDSSLAVYNAALEKKDYKTAMSVVTERREQHSYGDLKDEWEKRKQTVFEVCFLAPYLTELLKKGSVTSIDDKLSYEIPLENYNYYDNSLSITDNLGNRFYVEKESLLKSLKEVSGADFKLTQKKSIYRDATDEERQASNLESFSKGKLHTNLSYEYGTRWYQTIEFSEKKGEIYVSGIEKYRIFANQGFQKKDVIKKLTLTADDGSITEIPLQELTDNSRLLKIPAPATLEFTIQRGKGKKAETLTITVPVKWGVR